MVNISTLVEVLTLDIKQTEWKMKVLEKYFQVSLLPP